MSLYICTYIVLMRIVSEELYLKLTQTFYNNKISIENGIFVCHTVANTSLKIKQWNMQKIQ